VLLKLWLRSSPQEVKAKLQKAEEKQKTPCGERKSEERQKKAQSRKRLKHTTPQIEKESLEKKELRVKAVIKPQRPLRISPQRNKALTQLYVCQSERLIQQGKSLRHP